MAQSSSSSRTVPTRIRANIERQVEDYRRDLWRIEGLQRPPGPSRRRRYDNDVWGLTLGVLLSAGGFILLMELLGLVNPWIPVIGYSVAILAVFIVASIALFDAELDWNRRDAGIGWWSIREEIRAAFAIIFVALVFFALLCRASYPFLDLGFGGELRESLAFWATFTLDTFAESFFDLPSIYDVHLSPARAEGFASKTLVFLFRLGCDVVVIALVARKVRERKRIKQKLPF